MRRAIAIPIALLFAGARPDVAVGKPSTAELARADALLREGNAHYARKSYQQAIRAYQQAHDLTQAPGFLFNIAQVHRVAGNCAEAIAHYERYLAAEPKSRLRPRVEAFVAEMWRCVEERRKRDSAKEKEPATTPTPEPAAPPPAAQPEPTPGSATLTARAPAPQSASAWRWVGLATAAAGGLATGAGIYLALEARSEARRTEDFEGEWTPEDEAREQSAGREARRATILVSAGAVALVGGVTLYLLTRHPRERVAVAMTPSGPGAALAWSF